MAAGKGPLVTALGRGRRVLAGVAVLPTHAAVPHAACSAGRLSGKEKPSHQAPSGVEYGPGRYDHLGRQPPRQRHHPVPGAGLSVRL